MSLKYEQTGIAIKQCSGSAGDARHKTKSAQQLQDTRAIKVLSHGEPTCDQTELVFAPDEKQFERLAATLEATQ